MIDASEKPFKDNIDITRKVVEFADSFDAHVEAELGYVAKLGQDFEKRAFTDPDDAKKFVDETGVDALAVAIGSAHGFYKGTPRLELALLERINNKLAMPLVLHGGSGIPDDQIQQAVQKGICKINVATEIKNMFMKSLQTILAQNEEIDLRIVFPPAIESVKDLIIKKLNIINN
jgi:fructose-bisphosphate aldolase class II/tagatose 1,6-diphosphate aldolase GatY/KbaY